MIVVGWEAYKVLRPFLSPNFTMTDTTDKKQQYLDAAKALDALGDSALAEACRAKASTIAPPEPGHPWVRGRFGYSFRVSRLGDVVECRQDSYGDQCWQLDITVNTLRALAQQVGMIDPKDLKWGAMGYKKPGNYPAWVRDQDSKDDIMAHTASWAYMRIFQHLPTEIIK